MIKTFRRVSLGAVTLMTAAVLTAGPALAGHCTNADKNEAAGVQIVIDAFTFQVVFVSKGLQQRIDQGVVDPITFDGFHGLAGFDLNGDTVADATTYIVTPNFELPKAAQDAGAPCHGIVSINAFVAQCLT